MVLLIEMNSNDWRVEQVIKTIEDLGYAVQKSATQTNTILGVSGLNGDADIKQFSLIEGVSKVFKVSDPYIFASRDFRQDDTIVKLPGLDIGGEKFVMFAGPCAIENEKQIYTIAEKIAASGARVLRGGAFKPRTSPYSFQGLGKEGLRLIRKAADYFGLYVVTEILESSQIGMISEYTDIFQVGARNMYNYPLLKELGKIEKPVLLKRSFAATIEEFLMSAEYILAGGNSRVILCERGIRTFENSTRNTFDISAIPVIHKKSHLPVIADPSHASGFRDFVSPIARAAVAAGAQGLMLEVHHDPVHALSDGPQALLPDQYTKLIDEIKGILSVLGRQFN
ncbi:MAG: 3-deoxy-7-phosphoheptulonate synthase [Ignavibacteriaceae bacterium]|nr:3-deoxy-7-phosphoheptulonate synthase [Ignavibacteriaceae bacterium]NUM70366.1 3-deoxy-7-phosphoheptulonate synthase [Ignavibacteriaceae bacterium]